MDFASQKQWLIEEILRIQDADLIQKLRDLIQGSPNQGKLEPVTLDEFYARIDSAEQAYQEGKATSQEDLKNEIRTWRNR